MQLAVYFHFISSMFVKMNPIFQSIFIISSFCLSNRYINMDLCCSMAKSSKNV